jgi:hypothetical protein
MSLEGSMSTSRWRPLHKDKHIQKASRGRKDEHVAVEQQHTADTRHQRSSRNAFHSYIGDSARDRSENICACPTEQNSGEGMTNLTQFF